MNELTITKEISPIVARVSDMSITSSTDMQSATSLLSQLNKFNDAMTEEKEKLTKPLNEALKEIRSRYKPTELLLEESIATLKKKMGTYQALALAEQKKAEEKIASQLESGKIKKVETAIRKLGEIDAPDEKVVTDAGAVSFRTVKKFEVMEMEMLPMQYHLPDEVAIRKQMIAGVELPGVRYYEEQSIINKRN